MVVVEYSILQCMFFSWKYIDFTEKCCCLFVFFFVVTNLCIVPSNILSFSLLLVVVSICILFTNRKKPLIFFFETFLNFRNSFFFASKQHAYYTRLYSFKFNWRIVSFTAAKTKRMFSVSEKKKIFQHYFLFPILSTARQSIFE